MHEKVKERRSY